MNRTDEVTLMSIFNICCFWTLTEASTTLHERLNVSGRMLIAEYCFKFFQWHWPAVSIDSVTSIK